MSEPIQNLLSRFTPDEGGLDRDALLFAAGRASVRSSRRWPIVAGVLAACQAASLVLLWPWSMSAPAPSNVLPSPMAAGTTTEPPAPLDPFALGMLRSPLLAAEGNSTTPAVTLHMIPAEPPLRAFASLSSSAD